MRNRQVKEELAAFVKCAYELIGSGLAVLVGEPPDVELLVGDASSATIEELQDCDQALATCKSELQDEPTFGGAEGEQAIDPATIILIIDLVSKLIKAIIERRQSGG